MTSLPSSLAFFQLKYSDGKQDPENMSNMENDKSTFSSKYIISFQKDCYTFRSTQRKLAMLIGIVSQDTKFFSCFSI